MSENLYFYEPTEAQLTKFHNINQTPEWIHNTICANCNDCSVCHVAIHQHLISKTVHYCTYGMSENKFYAMMADADCEY